MTARAKPTLCAECKKGGHLHEALVVEGEPTREEQFGGQFSETFTRYRCRTCRALWELQEDAGLRGSSSRWTLLASA